MAVPSLPQSPVEVVLARLTGVVRNGADQWSARCPAHDDSSPSLRVKEGADGRAALHCHAGCTVKQICAAIGLDITDLFRDEPKKQERALAIVPRERPSLVCTYQYHAADGSVAFEACRFRYPNGKKEFKQRHQDKNGRGDWIWNLDGVDRVLYRLPDVIEAVALDHMIYVVEGEKDADRLVSLGLCGTTNPMGAGKWLDEYAETLRGASVAIIPDNDDVGRKHARKVAEGCHAAGCRVKIVELPNVAQKGDVSDWLDSGGTREALETLVLDTPRFDPSRDDRPSADRTRWRLDELWADDAMMRPPLPVLPRIAWRGRSTLLAATEKSGKSTLLSYAGAQLTHGLAFLGDACEQGPILWLCLEEAMPDLARRLHHFKADATYIHVVNRLGEDRAAELRAHIAAVKPLVVVIDTLAAYWRGVVSEASSSSQTQPIVQELTDIAHQMDVAVIIVHHARKSDGGYRDSSAIGGAVDLILEVFTPDEAGDPTRRQVRARGRIPVESFSFRFDGQVFTLAASYNAPLDVKILEILQHMPHASIRNLLGAIKCNTQELTDTVRRLIGEGKIIDDGTPTARRLRLPTIHRSAPVAPNPSENTDGPRPANRPDRPWER